MNPDEISKKLNEKGIKVTPQRIAVLEAVTKLNNHPNADNVIAYIRKKHPNISTATVYKTLETLVANNLLVKIKTDSDVMRYDAVTGNHHHLYCSTSNRIEDYNNEELNLMIKQYFAEKGIDDFTIEDIKLQIIGRFKNETSHE